MVILRDTFDFDIGLLVKSPCKECSRQKELPDCADDCDVLEEIQVILAKGISCTGRHPFLES